MSLRKIDVRSWDSAVAEQHAIQSLPHLVLYKGSEEVATGVERVLLRLHKL